MNRKGVCSPFERYEAQKVVLTIVSVLLKGLHFKKKKGPSQGRGASVAEGAIK